VNTSDPALHQEGVGTSDDAAHGGTPPCTGSAPAPTAHKPLTCQACGGFGSVRRSIGPRACEYDTCPYCGGSGQW
jgi:DnaJ-class molecular chaperone